jgi:hypothetical protein
VFHENRFIHADVKAMVSMKNSGESLERKLEKRLRDILESIPGLGSGVKVWRNPAASDRPFDIMGELELPRTKDRVELWVECKELPRPSQFPFVNLRNRFLQDGSRETVVPVLAAPHISPRMAELCEEHGWSWFDLAGNCRLVVPGSLYVERTGLAPVHERPKPKANLGTAASAQVLRTLLAPENAGNVWTQTVLQKTCEPGVSMGLVNKVVSYLRDEAWLATLEGGGFQVRDALGLLEAWDKVYRFDRHRRIGYFTLLKDGELQHRLGALNNSDGKAAYAAFSAANFQAPSVRQNKTWLYVNDAALDDFVQMAEAKRVDSGENLVVLVPEDDGVFYGLEFSQGWGLARANPVQTWLDLRSSGGRGQEAADAVLNQCLKPAWEGAVRHV